MTVDVAYTNTVVGGLTDKDFPVPEGCTSTCALTEYEQEMFESGLGWGPEEKEVEFGDTCKGPATTDPTWGVTCAMQEQCGTGCEAGECKWNWPGDDQDSATCGCAKCKAETEVIEEPVEFGDTCNKGTKSEWGATCRMQELCGTGCEPGECKWNFAAGDEDNAECGCAKCKDETVAFGDECNEPKIENPTWGTACRMQELCGTGCEPGECKWSWAGDDQDSAACGCAKCKADLDFLQ